MLKVYTINFLSITSPIRAYTLFGSLCWAYRLAYEEKELTRFLEEFRENPKFLISSPFPVAKYCEDCNEEEIKDVKETFLFPKPILPLKTKCEIPEVPKDGKEYLEKYICKKRERKNYKKAQFITEDILKDFINGEINEEATFIEKEDYKVFDKKIIYKSSKELKFLPDTKSTLLTKNVINRITSTSENLYTEEGTFYDTQFFLVKFYDNSFVKTFETLLKIIENLGIGKNKNIGWGKVEIKEINALNWLDEHIDNSENFITLSPVIPTKNISIYESFYEFETYKAPVENTFTSFLLKQKVIYLKEGSIIKSVNNNYKGQLKQVVKNPTIYQYGLEFPIKVKEL
ncbi:type III-A CRISPR-associated RAMP protein Csm4 [Persephonella atlantica]|uniref:CRISPR system Cms protein Csm4 n=1 Tax=Persephonella atlantica TaxID=2699429 RepID=A0ABS1GII3_9AQUI|nr:type III-A CRISPR-associated RAMP protein Csm4 [Persephonella atlantica]MBK3332631.1 type III-A CRISPR-associated RAMP protein Csm4 [Persephonella atlantica]